MYHSACASIYSENDANQKINSLCRLTMDTTVIAVRDKCDYERACIKYVKWCGQKCASVLLNAKMSASSNPVIYRSSGTRYE